MPVRPLMASLVLVCQALWGQSEAGGPVERNQDLLKALDRLVEQNRKLTEQNRELMDQIHSLRQSLASQSGPAQTVPAPIGPSPAQPGPDTVKAQSSAPA